MVIGADKTMTQIRKTYMAVNPELLYAEIRDFALKQGVSLVDSSMETYTLPDQSADFVSRGTLKFKCGKEENECLRAHIVGSGRTETKLIFDIDESLFPQAKIAAMQSDIDFIFGEYEVME
jgi:hypothetical protein